MLYHLDFILLWVAEEHPLKQGLKHFEASPKILTQIVAEEHPLKQGLKQ